MMPNPILALMELLGDDSEVQSQTGGRIFGVKLPASVTEVMPATAVVVTGGGSVQAIGNAYQEYGDLRMDVYTYGATDLEGFGLWLAVFPVLKQLRREVHAGCLLHWARPSIGSTQLRDPDTDWPYTLSSWQVMFSEVEVPA